MSESTATHQPTWVPLDFRKAVVSPGEQPGTLVVTVTGDTPRSSLRGAAVKLKPLTYDSQPEYWKFEVLWDATNATVPIVTPFTVSLAVDQFRGTKGIEVVGQSRSQKISF
jgi:hypothetical protein